MTTQEMDQARVEAFGERMLGIVNDGMPGHAINLMAEAFPASRFVVYDISSEGIAAGRAEAESKGLANASFEIRDVVKLDVEAGYDLVTAFDCIHDQAHPDRVLRGIHDMLRPGGTFLCVDVQASTDLAGNVDHPLGSFLYSVSCMHCMSVSLAQDGTGLGAMWGEQKALEMFAAAGFGDVRVATIDGDVFNNYYVVKR